MRVKFCYERSIVSFSVPDDSFGTELLYDRNSRRLRLIHGAHELDCLENWVFDGTFDESMETLEQAFDAEAKCGLKRVELDNEIIWMAQDTAKRVEEARSAHEKRGRQS